MTFTRSYQVLALLAVGMVLGYAAASWKGGEQRAGGVSPLIRSGEVVKTNLGDHDLFSQPHNPTTSQPQSSEQPALAQPPTKQPNIVYFFTDNLGQGELGCYGGGILRGTPTTRIDRFSREGIKLLNFAPESQCTPSRAALMTGRYAIRTGNHTVPAPGAKGGLVAWEVTIANILRRAGYACSIVGKWHLGTEDGRWPTDHGFDEWYGIPRSYTESLWPDDPWYKPERDGIVRLLEGKRGGKVKELEQLTMQVRRDIDLEYMKRAKAFLQRSVQKKQPFFLYFNHSMLHFPTVPRLEFKGKTGNGDFADCLLELDTDFGTLLDYLNELGVADNTIVVFSGDNGPEDRLPWRGTSGFFEGSYFGGSEGNLRTPCMIRYPGRVPPGQESNDVVHLTDMFTTLVTWAGASIPRDREIDGKNQRAFFEGKQKESAREGFPYWMGPTLYGVKWRNFKVKMVEQKYFTDPVRHLPYPHLINLVVDPKEREPFNYPHLHSWVHRHTGRILREFNESTQREPLIPAGAPLDFVPRRKPTP